nr:branched-chain-amino-acid aminotransferase 2, chloroplastic [Quercus suber]
MEWEEFSRRVFDVGLGGNGFGMEDAFGVEFVRDEVGEQNQEEELNASSLLKQTWLESKELWAIAGPSIFSRLAMFSMTVITQSFSGHLSDLDLAAICIASTVIIAITFGFLAVYEGTKVHRKEDGRLLLFHPEQNAIRRKFGAERMCMPSPSIDQFVDAVRQTVLANKRWVPPPGKGSLYIRPLLMGSGQILGLGAAPEYTFLVYVSPVGNYFKGGFAPLNLYVEKYLDRASPRSRNVHVIPIDELIDADEVFCTEIAVGVASVGSITYEGKR